MPSVSMTSESGKNTASKNRLMGLFRRREAVEKVPEGPVRTVDQWRPKILDATPEARMAFRARLPAVGLKYDQFMSLPRAEDLGAWKLTDTWRPELAVGTMFKIAGSTKIGDAIIGVVVETGDALFDQVGGGVLTLGPKFVNKYRPIITDLTDFQI
jgi:hypothetical protein